MVIHEDEYDTFYKLFLKIDVDYHASEVLSLAQLSVFSCTGNMLLLSFIL